MQKNYLSSIGMLFIVLPFVASCANAASTVSPTPVVEAPAILQTTPTAIKAPDHLAKTKELNVGNKTVTKTIITTKLMTPIITTRILETITSSTPSPQAGSTPDPSTVWKLNTVSANVLGFVGEINFGISEDLATRKVRPAKELVPNPSFPNASESIIEAVYRYLHFASTQDGYSGSFEQFITDLKNGKSPIIKVMATDPKKGLLDNKYETKIDPRKPLSVILTNHLAYDGIVLGGQQTTADGSKLIGVSIKIKVDSQGAATLECYFPPERIVTKKYAMGPSYEAAICVRNALQYLALPEKLQSNLSASAYYEWSSNHLAVIRYITDTFMVIGDQNGINPSILLIE